MTTVENFMSELRRMLVTTSTKSESLRAAAIAEPTSTNSGFGARYAIEFSEEIQNRSDLLRSQTSKMAALCSTAPDMGAMAKALEQALLYNDHLIDLLEERASEYGYEVPCRPSPSKVPLDGPITPGVLHGQSRNATPLPKSLSTPKRSVKKIPEMEDLPPRTPTLADFGISYDEVENLVCNPPLTTPHHGVTRVSEQQDHSSVMEADDPEYEPPQSCEDVEHDETSTLSTPRQVKTALCFHESDGEDLIPDERYNRLVSSFARSRAPLKVLRKSVSHLRDQYGSQPRAAFVPQAELEANLGVGHESVKAVALALTQLKIVAIKRDQDRIGYFWSGGFPVSQ